MELKKPILALDYGDRRIGVAISDAFHWTARPLTTFDQKTCPDFLQKLKKIIETEEIGEVVIGLPANMNGSQGHAVDKVRLFAQQLQEIITCPIEFEDERLTSSLAQEMIRESGLSKKKRRQKATIDQTAAALILRSYLSRKSTSKPAGATDFLNPQDLENL